VQEHGASYKSLSPSFKEINENTTEKIKTEKKRVFFTKFEVI
jgi:hypothetical protein